VTPVRTLASSLLLRMPAWLRSLRRLPVVGELIHRVSHFVLPVNQMAWAQVRCGPAQGLWIEVFPRTGHYYLTSGAELHTQSVLIQRLRSGDVFYDLGANIGLFSLLAARCVGNSGKVFSFEPDAVNAERIRRNAERNSFSQITVIESGVWSSAGTLDFATADCASPDRGLGSFLPANAGSASTPIRVIALDDFVLDAPRPDGIKCDIEGAEVHALRGAERLLASHHPWILAEMHSESNDRVSRELLSDFGYTVETIDSNHVLALPQPRSAVIRETK
jgi:FkbM family methyltransferase